MRELVRAGVEDTGGQLRLKGAIREVREHRSVFGKLEQRDNPCRVRAIDRVGGSHSGWSKTKAKSHNSRC